MLRLSAFVKYLRSTFRATLFDLGAFISDVTTEDRTRTELFSSFRRTSTSYTSSEMIEVEHCIVRIVRHCRCRCMSG